ncbi:CapA family protein [Catenisphaera adipataccumulans]|uniref:Poly-gamma-glutamate synthesis protein (Capsule biosynthesis protein) n=1 Tax=Catenisphaera adipataccumulans TaxID=700500 RepID=A0A7W8FVN4_9FIRM|nr:CapA family protein [Catenisphaera adipataccumulans]MBB5183804.1 poly-gamma-glutamate synthesis protein (capsule biosynthesis protein) [Catenisphaera adipataccumulans]
MRKWAICFLCMCVFAKLMSMVQTQQSSAYRAQQTEESNQSDTASFTFMGVGDNLIHGAIYYWQQQAGDGYNFDSMYKPISKYTNKDINYINYETICAGEELGLEGYPLFNGPVEINDAVYKAGFNWMSLCSNHTYDMGLEGVVKELNYMHKNCPDMTVTGAYTSKKAAQTPTVIKVNGLRIGLASYTYGLNGFKLDDDHKWLINQISESKIKSDIKKLNKVSDVQMVTMHWGTEYQTTPNAMQKKYAKLLNKLGVEVIIGTHPHVIEPVTYIKGDKQDTLCYYSLGNFISAQDHNENMIGGMAGFKLIYHFDTGKTEFKNVTFTPTITYYNSNFKNFKTYTIHEWNDDLAATHLCTVSEGEDMTKQWVQDYVKGVMGDLKGIKVIYS